MAVVTDTGPFAIVPEWLLTSAVSDRAVRLYALLARYADKEGYSFPRRRVLAERLYCSSKSVDRALEELSELGALEIHERFSENGDQISNLYRLIRVPPSSLVTPPLDTGDAQNESHYNDGELPKGSSRAPGKNGRASNPIWDALVEVFGEPSTASSTRLRGKVCSSLTKAGATPEEILRRARSWPRYFDDATLTVPALEKHWDTLGRPPLRVSREF